MLKPMDEQVIVIEKPEGEAVSAGGIIQPAVTKKSLRRGEVVAAGAKRLEDGKLFPYDLPAGTIIFFHSNQAHEVADGGKQFYVVPYAAILCKVQAD